MEQYPRPFAPLHPVLSVNAIKLLGQKSTIPTLFEDRSDSSSILLTSGRMAIAYALKLLGIKSGDNVLLPAYHCSSMIDPIVWIGATPVFYKIHRDCSVDMQDIESKLDSSTKLLLITHYFGFHQDLLSIREFCDKNKISLLEDCAHASFGRYQGKPLGSYGDFAIASAMKFFPVYDGGCLVSYKHSLNSSSTESAKLRFQLKSIFNTLEKAFEYNRLPLLKHTIGLTLRLKDILWGKLKSSQKNLAAATLGPAASDGGFDFDGEWVNVNISTSSKFIVQHSNLQNNIQKRRENYLSLHKAFKNLAGTSPLFEKLPDDVVPYVYPLIVEDAGKLFPLLKRKAVPIIRFGEFLYEEITEKVCKNTIYLSDHVFQFPCHQELTSKELAKIISTVQDTIQQHSTFVDRG